MRVVKPDAFLLRCHKRCHLNEIGLRILIGAIALCAVSASPLQAADIRNMNGTVTNGRATAGSFGIVLEGKIEAGDYDKLRSCLRGYTGQPFLYWFTRHKLVLSRIAGR